MALTPARSQGQDLDTFALGYPEVAVVGARGATGAFTNRSFREPLGRQGPKPSNFSQGERESDGFSQGEETSSPLVG